jgi:delta-aminolevulinic acid dehydratase/porphobilinogen synthase
VLVADVTSLPFSVVCTGADIIITYFAPQLLKWLKEE